MFPLGWNILGDSHWFLMKLDRLALEDEGNDSGGELGWEVALGSQLGVRVWDLDFLRRPSWSRLLVGSRLKAKSKKSVCIQTWSDLVFLPSYHFKLADLFPPKKAIKFSFEWVSYRQRQE